MSSMACNRSLQSDPIYRKCVLGLAVVVLCLVGAQTLLERCLRYQFTTTASPDHLILIQHGFMAPWIQCYALGRYMAKTAMQRSKAVRGKRGGYLIQVLRANSSDYVFGFYSTSNGIVNGAARTCDEIKRILEEYPSITKLSVIGSSLGGLYARQLCKQLYDKHQQCLCYNGRCLSACNFISLATPHLGVAGKIHGWFVAAAKCLHRFYLLPPTVAELLALDGAQILKQMAQTDEYLKPLDLFANRVIYANTVNDNRVSLSSGLILPSFEYEDEQQYTQQRYLEDIAYSRSNKLCVIRPFSELHHHTEDIIDDLWYKQFMKDLHWKRFVVSINSSRLSTYFAHELLSHPNDIFNDCQPVLSHLVQQFKW